MTGAPASSLTFLSPIERDAMVHLVQRYQGFRDAIENEMNIGDLEALLIRADGMKIKEPTRNARESGDVHDAAYGEAVRQRFEVFHQSLHRRWNSGIILHDQLGSLIGLQDEVKQMLESAATKQGASKRIRSAPVPEEVDAALARLEGGLRDFVAVPLAGLHASQQRKLDDTSADIATLNNERIAACDGIKGRINRDQNRVTRQLEGFNAREKDCVDHIDSVKATIRTEAEMLPRLNRYMNDWRRSMAEAGRGHP